MGVLRDRPTVIATLLLATLLLSGVVADGHRDHSLATSIGHEGLPTFAAGHEQPDHTAHIEGATRIEPASCVGCLQRQRQRADQMPEPVLGALDSGSSAIATESAGRSTADTLRLKAPRAPPGA